MLISQQRGKLRRSIGVYIEEVLFYLYLHSRLKLPPSLPADQEVQRADGSRGDRAIRAIASVLGHRFQSAGPHPVLYGGTYRFGVIILLHIEIRHLLD